MDKRSFFDALPLMVCMAAISGLTVESGRLLWDMHKASMEQRQEIADKAHAKEFTLSGWTHAGDRATYSAFITEKALAQHPDLPRQLNADFALCAWGLPEDSLVSARGFFEAAEMDDPRISHDAEFKNLKISPRQP